MVTAEAVDAGQIERPGAAHDPDPAVRADVQIEYAPAGAGQRDMLELVAVIAIQSDAGDGEPDIPMPISCDDGRHRWIPAGPPKGLVGIREAGHFSFTELCSVNVLEIAARFDLDASNIVDDGCGPDFLPPEDFNRVQNYFAAAFFNHFLRGSERAAEDLEPANLPLEIDNFVEYFEEGLAP